MICICWSFKKMSKEIFIRNGDIGYVYVIKNTNHPENFYKIGKTNRNFKSRLDDFNNTSGELYFFEKIRVWLVNECSKLEKLLHLEFEKQRIRKEFFCIELAKIDETVLKVFNDKTKNIEICDEKSFDEIKNLKIQKIIKKYKLKGFTKWIVINFVNEKSTGIYDLVNDIVKDLENKKWPIYSEKYLDYYEYLDNKHACSGALDCLKEAWDLYEEEFDLDNDYLEEHETCEVCDDDDCDCYNI